MREWNLKPEDPLSLTLAADARLGPTNYVDDQIWELSLGGGEPRALAVQSTFGLRARILRMFPRFTEGDLTLIDPADFNRAPTITRSYPNFLSLLFSPFPDIDVESQYWVPQCQAIGGRLALINRSQELRQVRLEWVGQLTPTDGQRMALQEIQAAPVLAGTTDGLAPVIFLTGGPRAGAGSYPSLSLVVDLPADSSRSFTWAHAALGKPEESFDLARQVAARNWDGEIARLDLLNSSQIDIHTGDPDWDAAFAITQKLAFNLFVGPTPHLIHPSFVLTRQPDQGFSLRGDGSDYNHLWNGQSPLEAYYLSSLILPTAPDLAKGLLKNFLQTQTENGFVDWKPGLAGQRSRLMATPILASLAWRIYEFTEDRVFLEEIFPALLAFVRAWFSPERDRDGDGVPEWDHPMQSGFEDHPLFSRWSSWCQGVEISTAEGPALCSFLYRECQTLIKMAETLDTTDPIPALQTLCDQLCIAVESSWSPEEASYHDWDRDTHFCTQGEWLGQCQGPGKIPIQRAFDHPVRLLARIETNGESTRRPQVFVHGISASGYHRVERLADDPFRWYLGNGTLTGDRVYSMLDEVEIQGLDPHDQVNLYSAGYYSQEISLLLPLWAGIPDPDRAEQLVEETVKNLELYWRPYGLPACPRFPATDEYTACQNISMSSNAILGEGLLQYGFRAEATELVSRLMAAVVKNLKCNSDFRRYYGAEDGRGSGERNALNGLAPLGLFLDTLGVRIISPKKVALSGFNPFPWPVTVKYRGLTVLLQKEKTILIFADGQTIVVDDPEPRMISLEVQ